MFIADLFAGVTVGIVALPLAMAFAIASGVGPERGVFTAIVAGFIISFLGGSRFQIGGPTGAFIVIVSGIIVSYGYSGLVCATFMAGVLLVIFGLSGFGSLIKFIPFPVTTGFTSGIAVVIFSTQIKDLFGLDLSAVPSGFVDKWVAYFNAAHTFAPVSIGLSVLTIGVIVFVRRVAPRLPAMLLGMLAATVAAIVLGLDAPTIGSRFGELARMLPAPSLPDVGFEELKRLVAPAFTIAILAAIESLLSATVADGMTGDRHDSNMELVGQGFANIGSALFGGIPATGAIARTATSIKSGSKSPVAGMIHAITLGLVLLFCAPWAGLVPMSALAGILVVVSWNMSEAHHFVALLRAPKSDVVVLLMTFLLTVFVDLTVAVEVGLMLACLLFIRRISDVSNVRVITNEIYGEHEESDMVDPNSIRRRNVPSGVEVYEINGPFFFGAADKFSETIRTSIRAKVIIIRIRHVLSIDSTGLHMLNILLRDFRRENVSLLLSGVHSQPLFAMQKSGFLDEIGEENIFGNIDDALNRAREILGLDPRPRPEPFVPTVSRERN